MSRESFKRWGKAATVLTESSNTVQENRMGNEDECTGMGNTKISIQTGNKTDFFLFKFPSLPQRH